MPLPPLTEAHARQIAAQHYGLQVQAQRLPGELDANFLLSAGEERYILKVGNADHDPAELDFQNRALAHLTALPGVPRLIPARSGEEMPIVEHDGQRHFIRLLSYLPGEPLVRCPDRSPELLRGLGAFLARLDQALADFQHPAMERDIPWNLAHAHRVIRPRLHAIPDPVRRRWVERALERFEQQVRPYLPTLRAQVIHNDANDHNVLVAQGQVVGLLDFGDMLHAPLICEVAIAATYALLASPEPLQAAAHLVAGYHQVIPLTTTEVALLDGLIRARLAVSAALSAERALIEPENPYHQISAGPVWAALERLDPVPAEVAHGVFRQACGLPAFPSLAAAPAQPGRDEQTILAARRRYLNPTLSVSYRRPLHMVRGQGQYLYDAEGRAYLDCVNNVCHVGHSHPAVVAALAHQAALLNTNTRYLHEHIITLAERLTAHMPGDLSVWFFVNSGSEANDLALRLVRAYTGRQDMLVLAGAYHGNLSSLIDISPYKFDGPGGAGAPPWVHTLSMPCTYRGRFRHAEDPVAAYVEEAAGIIRQVEEAGRGVAAFIAEALMGTGGQVVFPPGYLAQMYALVRAAGGLCIADEVQIGFGRVGTHFWGFETHGVVPDIVTMGKPMGNGHPLAAVVTTPEIAASFVTGMEYFNTFGGNPVSCAVGLAVLDVIEEQNLQEHARRVGEHLKARLKTLQERHPLIGDVRGSGLFLGVELVRDRETLAPAAGEAQAIVEAMRERGILLSTDGPFHNVLKIKPPLVFNQEDADRLVEELEGVLQEVEQPA
ncbi:aminotransferase class III-fold pyridoxal phosphate-dependent enzyme [Litorilinea aerophila]|nr:aminotransferase class III-fold pyridoxal phosphate-dependent enzyme [Litorilinea aerophila]MCC9076304.1 aminotransferase class III-fold pyridoxal phosphate-dependent enzyme [Litorilinea aerophila]